MTATVIPFKSPKDRKTVEELDLEFRFAVQEVAAKFERRVAGIEDMRKAVMAYDRWRAAFFNEPGNL